MLKLSNLLAGLLMMAVITTSWANTEHSKTITEKLKTVCQVYSIEKGDKIKAICHDRKVTILFRCIYAPELYQKPWGRESFNYLRSILPDAVQIVEYSRDRSGHSIAEVFDGAKSLNLEMVTKGHASTHRLFCDDHRFFAAQQQASDAQLGIWNKPGRHQQPSFVRRLEFQHRIRSNSQLSPISEFILQIVFLILLLILSIIILRNLSAFGQRQENNKIKKSGTQK
jgi:endonuclease YncB( thermonuclease family)